MDPYEVLDVPRDADADQVKRAHRRAARKHHPDKGGERDDFERIQHAYLVLADPERREKYDRTGKVEDEVENPLAEMAGHVLAAFDLACQQNIHWLTRKDLVAATRTVMEGQLTTMRGQLKNLQAEVPKLEQLLKRLQFTGDGVDIIGNALTERVKSIQENIAEGEKTIAQYTAAIAYLDHYGFEFDQPPTGGMQGTTGWTLST